MSNALEGMIEVLRANTQHSVKLERSNYDPILPPRAEEGTLWPPAIVGVVRPARAPTTQR